MYFREPKYYGDFHCAGSECTNNCCVLWRIDWAEEEIKKVKNAQSASRELKLLVEDSFIKSESSSKNFFVKLDKKRQCPFQLENGLCKIQSELGAEYLSHTCTVYPRGGFSANEYSYRACAMSCPEVVKMVCDDEDALTLINLPNSNNVQEFAQRHSKEKLEASPELKYHSELLEFFYSLIADKSVEPETAIILGALAAQSLTKLVSDGKADNIPDALIQIKRSLHNEAQIQQVNSIKPNYMVKFGIVDDLCINECEFTICRALRDETGTPNIEYYLLGENNLNAMFADRPFWFRNIALNTLLAMRMPFNTNMKNRTIFENYMYFAAVIGCYKLNAVAAAAMQNEVDIQVQNQTFRFAGDQKIFGVISLVSRGLLQNNQEPQKILRRLLEYARLTPALAALLVK